VPAPHLQSAAAAAPAVPGTFREHIHATGRGLAFGSAVIVSRDLAGRLVAGAAGGAAGGAAVISSIWIGPTAMA